MADIYLVPCVLADDASQTIPSYVIDAVKKCDVIFAESERTARRFLKMMDKSIVIDSFEWFAIHKAEDEEIKNFTQKIKEEKTIAIISEAGCPGVADPGQILIAAAQKLKCVIKPLVGPNSILLALMASGMNGQQFDFVGYLPIDNNERTKRIKELEISSQKNNSTKIFIETPYRNNQLVESILKTCDNKTLFCVAVNLTGVNESVKTMPVSEWKKIKPELHKLPTIFLMYSGFL